MASGSQQRIELFAAIAWTATRIDSGSRRHIVPYIYVIGMIRVVDKR